ncbi:MAG: amidinotransferase [Pseudomonadota bacterium]
MADTALNPARNPSPGGPDAASAARAVAPRLDAAAYGGAGWQPRETTHAEEIGGLWRASGIASEWASLDSVLLSPPGAALAAAAGDPDAAQLLAPVDLTRAVAEHAALAGCYADASVSVIEIAPSATHPNQMFCADLFAMTPQGAILARPASRVRAGEEVAVAAALAGAGVPILATLTGRATFEGADLMWLAPDRALIGLGQRTNDAAARRIGGILGEIGVTLETVDLPIGTMHLMGMLRILGPDLAVGWPRRLATRAVAMLAESGIDTAFPDPAIAEAEMNTGMNVVTLGPRRILMPAGQPAMRAFYEGLGVQVMQTGMAELSRAAGAVGCLTGIVGRREGRA